MQVQTHIFIKTRIIHILYSVGKNQDIKRKIKIKLLLMHKN